MSLIPIASIPAAAFDEAAPRAVAGLIFDRSMSLDSTSAGVPRRFPEFFWFDQQPYFARDLREAEREIVAAERDHLICVHAG